MRIAVFHNFLDNIGGAEIVCLTLARELNADLYTTNINPEKIKKMGFEDVLPRIKSIGNVPLNPPFKQQSTFNKFRKLNLKDKYDFFIMGGDWTISASVNNKPNLEYFHSPLNEIWAFRDETQKSLSWWMRPAYRVWTEILRIYYRKYFKQIERRVCNSKNTQERIARYLNSDAEIIYPPIEVSKYKFKKSEGYWLSVNRLIPHKRIEMQLKTFSKLPDEKLIIVGSYEKGVKHLEQYKKELEEIIPPNVEIVHWTEDKKLKELYSRCKGFITTAKDEDFGMTAIEAMASGKPVITPNEGGYRESVINGKTGILIDEINEVKLSDAIKKISKELKTKPNKYKNPSINQAKNFDVSVFIEKIKKEIQK